MFGLSRSTLALISLILLAGGMLLDFFIVLSGAVNSSPVNQVYFLEATTNGIRPQPRNPTRWTYFALCGVDGNGKNTDCGATIPDLPFSPPGKSNFGTENGVPEAFVGTHYYYYMSRFAWVFYLMALIFACIGLLTGLMAICTKIGGYLSGMVVIGALFWQTLAAALATTWVVKGRDVFRGANQDAKVGVKAIAFSWAAMACYFLSTIIFCISGGAGSSSDRKSRSGSSRRRSSRGRGVFSVGRSKSKSTRSRTSFDS